MALPGADAAFRLRASISPVAVHVELGQADSPGAAKAVSQVTLLLYPGQTTRPPQQIAAACNKAFAADSAGLTMSGIFNFPHPLLTIRFLEI